MKQELCKIELTDETRLLVGIHIDVAVLTFCVLTDIWGRRLSFFFFLSYN